jgi:hypothetical protein
MKKGKSCSIKGYKKIKCSYGTVDSKNFKSIYLNIQSWVEPKSIENSWIRLVSYFNKQIKNTIGDYIDEEFFYNNFIVDLDLRTSGIALKKRSFMNLEITFFIKKPTDFKSVEIKNSLKKIVSCLESEIFNKSNHFNFHLSKNDKIKKESKIEFV